MTQELKMTTPRAGKRMAEQLSASIRKRARTTPMHDAKPRTPASMMRKLVTARRHPDSNASHVSRASMVSKNSSVGTSDLMPDTSPPHTTTFTLPKSRVAGTVKPRDERFGFGEDDDDDDILDEINSLIKRYDSPSRPSAKSVRSRGSVARSEVSVMSRASVDSRVSGVSGLLAQGEEMTQLADKYASPGLPTVRVPGTGDSQRVRGLVADMEELLDEAEAVQASESAPAIDDFDDEIPSPPHIVSDLERPRVVAREISAEPEISAAPVVRPVSGANAGRRDPAPRAGGVRRTFGGRQISMDVEQMDEENMTIGHMSPLALRQQQQRRQTHAPRFASLQEADEDDPFGPTPPRTQADSTRSWTGGAPGERSSTFDATATFGTPGSEHYTRDSRLNDSGGDLAVQIDGTTTILPTREMLQQAAQLAEEGDSDDGGIGNGDGGIDNGGIDNGGIDDDDDDDDDEGGELVEFDAELFPPAFRGPPASLQLRELYDLARSQAQRLWSLDDLLAASSPALCDAGPSVLQVLLDLLARRRVLRQAGDNLWTAH
ncbi:hypothetical protein GGF43_005712 [Coemansia sp. RSA 2618]|nr:hypothetical protein GGF43_005712 [Coemansia sp. RSA 2618]